MIIKVLKHLFLICTSISIVSSVLIEAYNLQYDDNGIGGVIFLVSFITGFVRFLVHEIMGLLSGSGFTKVALISEPYKQR